MHPLGIIAHAAAQTGGSGGEFCGGTLNGLERRGVIGHRRIHALRGLGKALGRLPQGLGGALGLAQGVLGRSRQGRDLTLQLLRERAHFGAQLRKVCDRAFELWIGHELARG